VMNKRTGLEETRAPIFRDSVVGNIADEIALLYDFAAIMPAELMTLANDMVETIPDADVIRGSDTVRKDVGNKTSALLATIDGMLGE